MAGDRWFARIDTPGQSNFSALFGCDPATGTKGKHD